MVERLIEGGSALDDLNDDFRSRDETDDFDLKSSQIVSVRIQKRYKSLLDNFSKMKQMKD